MRSNGATPNGATPKPADLDIPGLRMASDLAPPVDLVIASRKYGRGSTSQADAPILWWKLVGRPKEVPPRPCSLVDPVIQKRLRAYKLVDTEVQANQVVRRYRKLCELCDQPATVDGYCADHYNILATPGQSVLAEYMGTS